jgi:hypothetical protein
MEEVGRIVPNEVLNIDLVVNGLLGHLDRPAECPFWEDGVEYRDLWCLYLGPKQ